MSNLAELLGKARLKNLTGAEFDHLGELLQAATPEDASAFLERVSSEVKALVLRQDPMDTPLVERTVRLFSGLGLDEFEGHALVILHALGSFYLYLGKFRQAITTFEPLLPVVRRKGKPDALRRLHNTLGVCYADVADFSKAMEHYDSALTIAREMGDRFLESAALVNAMGGLKQMGLYQDAIDVGNQVLAMKIDTEAGRDVRFQCSSIGLFCAHRLRDHSAALAFLSEGSSLLDCPAITPFNRATFEQSRANYLIDTYDAETAEMCLAAAREALRDCKNPRVQMHIAISSAVAQWASASSMDPPDWRRILGSRASLKDMYRESSDAKWEFGDLLRALLKTHSNAESPDVARQGMEYGRELVEFATNFRRAKFYRQLTDQGVYMENSVIRPFDPFKNSRNWLNGAPIESPPKVIPAPRIEKHPEVTAIHEDIASLRVQAFRSEIKTLAYATAENWALAAEFFDDDTGKHCFRVGYLAGQLAQQINLEPQFCVQIEHAARLHDIGKIAVNEMILLKPGRLDPQELAAMQLHTQAGADMLDGTNDPTLRLAITVAKYHHEWWNGEGYPARLSFDRIPIAARITALADVYDALTNVRPYKVAWKPAAAIDEMQRLTGLQFDPTLVPAFLQVLERYVPMLEENRIPGLKDLEDNALLLSRRNLLSTINASPGLATSARK